MKLSQLKEDLIVSLKKGDSVRVETLRYLLSAVTNSGIDKYGATAEGKVTEEDVGDVIKKQVKTHKESIVAFKTAGRTDLVEREQAQLTILESFLPDQMTDAELEKILQDVVSQGETNFGVLMGRAMAKVKGNADGGRVSTILRKLLRL